MIIQRLKDLGYDYSPSSTQVLDLPFHSASKVGNLVFTSGQIPLLGDQKTMGKVGSTVSLEQAQNAAEICAFNCLRAAGSVVDINKVKRVVKVMGMVNCAEGFNDTSTVINGASLFFNKVFEDSVMHARSAVGMQIPKDWSVEVEAIFEIED